VVFRIPCFVVHAWLSLTKLMPNRIKDLKRRRWRKTKKEKELTNFSEPGSQRSPYSWVRD